MPTPTTSLATLLGALTATRTALVRKAVTVTAPGFHESVPLSSRSRPRGREGLGDHPRGLFAASQCSHRIVRHRTLNPSRAHR